MDSPSEGLHVKVEALLVAVIVTLLPLQNAADDGLSDKVGFALTTTVVAHVAVLPHASIAVHVTVEVPTLNVPLASLPVPLLLVGALML